ncbi:hypothetical protein TYRP_013743 [Tyrophagus putrescentiae]|nr:hypothetical protein TYRP_013743 [Tyrophagus putrescentiae]
MAADVAKSGTTEEGECNTPSSSKNRKGGSGGLSNVQVVVLQLQGVLTARFRSMLLKQSI